MGILSGFNKKEVQGKLELEIVLAKLSTLAMYMENGEDKETDLKMWTEAMTSLYELATIKGEHLPQLKKSYYIIYKLYLQKHHPELTIS